MNAVPTTDEVQTVINGLVTIEDLLVRLVKANEALTVERDGLAAQLKAADEASWLYQKALTAPGEEGVMTDVPVSAPNTIDRRCLECDNPFTFEPRYGGRPPVCCGDACKETRRKKQIVAGRPKPKVAASGSQGEGVRSSPVAAHVAVGTSPLAPLPDAAATPTVERYRREQEQATNTGAFAPEKALQPERRCGRCCSKYTPLDKADYYCARCRANGAGAVDRRRPSEEMQVAWSGSSREPLTNKVATDNAPASSADLQSQLAPSLTARAGF